MNWYKKAEAIDDLLNKVKIVVTNLGYKYPDVDLRTIDSNQLKQMLMESNWIPKSVGISNVRMDPDRFIGAVQQFIQNPTDIDEAANETSFKVMYIMRGLPGSGKSTAARELGEGGIVLGADDFWETEDGYQFDNSKKREAHAWNANRVFDALEKGISPIVVDNTNVEAYEPKPYVQAAMKFGYKIEFRESTAPWKFDVDELTARNTHGVDRHNMQGKLDAWHPDLNVKDVMQSEFPHENPFEKRYVK